MESYPMVSILMPNYNGVWYVGADDLKDILESFMLADYPNAELLFIDNGSQDNSVEVATEVGNRLKEKASVKLKVLRFRSEGYTHGCNMALRIAKGDYIVIVNNDEKVSDRTWLKKLVQVCEKRKEIGACFGKKLKWNEPRIIDSIGLSLNKAGFVRQIGFNEEDKGQYDKEIKMFIYQTPVAIKSKVLEEIGGLFDRNYVLLYTDVDLSWRILMADYILVYTPEVVVYHKRSATIKNLPVKYVTFHGRKNAIQTLIKNYEFKNIIKWLPLQLTIYIGSIFYYLSIRRLDHAEATLRAILWNLKNFRSVWMKRMYIQKHRRIPDKEIMKYMDSFDIWTFMKREKIWPR